MQIGMIGLGRMGGNMAERLRRAGHDVVGYDRDPKLSDVASLEELTDRLAAPRAVWVMVPAGEVTRQTIAELRGMLEPGDLVIDGGNSHYTDDRDNARLLGTAKIGFADAGVSGGVWGLENGYGLMVGGEDGDVAKLMPLFEALKPAGEAGFVHAGKVGAGHFTKMVHNGIEYGIMQAYAEGYELLVAADSGEGRWTVQAAIDHAVPMPVISAALFARFASRQDDSPSMKVVAALRNQFG